MLELPELDKKQLLYLQIIFDHFREEGSWPTYGYLERCFYKNYPEMEDVEIEEIEKSLPDSFTNGKLVHWNPKLEAPLTVLALCMFPDAKEDLANFIRVVRFCAEAYIAADKDEVEITSQEIGQALDIAGQPLHRIAFLLRGERNMFNVFHTMADGWKANFVRSIRRFRKLETIEQYFEIQSSFNVTNDSQAQSTKIEEGSKKNSNIKNAVDFLRDLGYPDQEGPLLEIKAGVPSASDLARLMASFANTEGGAIVIGIREDMALIGVPEDVSLEHLYNEAFSLLRPHPLMDYRSVTVRGKQIFIITVKKYPAPILTEKGRYYVRQNNSSVLMEENLIQGLATAVPSIKPNILNSLGVEKKTAENIDATGKFTETVHAKLEETTNITKIYEILLEPIKRSRDETAAQLNECRWQKRLTFIVTLIFLAIAILLVFIGVILIFTNHQQVGAVSTVASILSGIVSGVAFAFNKQANDNNDKFYEKMVSLERYYSTVQCIPLISDVQMMNETLRDFIKNNYQGI